MPTTYNVSVWKTEKYQGERVTTHTVRWTVDGKSRKKAFRTAAQADSFRSELLAATRRGEAFDVGSGRPVSSDRATRVMSWYDFACAYVDMKWKPAAGKYRRSIAEALTTVTPVLFTTARGKPDDREIRLALIGWAFNTNRRDTEDKPQWVRDTLGWVERNTKPVSAFAEPQVTRTVLDAVASKLDGKRAAGTTVNRKRAVLTNALGYAVELGLLTSNPIDAVKWRAPKAVEAIDRRSVVNPVQARTLLNTVRAQMPNGPRFVAFFAAMYYAALRPEEAVTLSRSVLAIPEKGWGEFHLTRAEPDTGKRWTDSGNQRDDRQLKHRAEGETRVVPCPPELTTILREHLAEFGTDAAGRLFQGARGGEVGASAYGRIWDRARRATFTPEVYASPLGKRPYDLRHAAVSTWLNGGVQPAQVAEWAGHSIAVLLRVYAKCLDGGDAVARQRIEAALGHRPG